ncbi:hypothetical protein BV898_16467 [Hypsibius exemplaris]|uniref:Metallo-beta-lactamase domain-containing protein n=1 Tax=Hypsibius exemplaris TaxID=2072580 RepID=A0A9X6RLV3_HYPEX|nr:hypothetical protein BV898_16467 [Hypsibius exemplaris]
MLTLAVVIVTLLPGCVPAAVSQIKTPGPGFFRLMLGEFEITAINDGTVALDHEALMPNASKEELLRARQEAFMPSSAIMSCNAFLVNTKQHLVLIDTGAGSLMGPSFGRLVENILAAGYQPEQIDNVLLTHLHPDHMGGVTSTNRMRFPNAVIRTSQAEVDFWLNPEMVQTNASARFKQRSKIARATLAPYQTVNRLKPFNATEKEILPGFRVVIRAGHSPGHTQFFVESGGLTMVAWGDITHFEWAQLRNPALTVTFDFNQPEAARDRLELFELVAEKRFLVAAAHVPFPGLGYLRRSAGQGFDWIPARVKGSLELLELLGKKRFRVAAAHVAFPGLVYVQRAAGQRFDWVPVSTLLHSCMSAAVPQIKTPGPGFFRLMLGDFEVTTISDGTLALNPEFIMPDAPSDEIERARRAAFVPRPAPISGNAFLVNTKDHLVLIDTGAGSLMGPYFGKLLENIRAAGYRPEQIDNVFLTHLHTDHMGGVTTTDDDHRMVFPNAVIRTSQAEVDFWMNSANAPKVHDIIKPTFAQAQAALAPYQRANRFQPFNATEDEILPGFRVVIRAGHSPGHTQYFVESAGQTMVVWGDITHFLWAQLPNPALTVLLDLDATEAVKDRRELLELLVEKKFWVAGAHIPFPGIGHLRRTVRLGNGYETVGLANGYEWVPVVYDSEPERLVTADFVETANATTRPSS